MTFNIYTRYSDERWRHNNTDLDSLDGENSYTIDAVTAQDAGVYECHRNNRHHEGKHAIFQLIVRGILTSSFDYSLITGVCVCLKMDIGVVHDPLLLIKRGDLHFPRGFFFFFFQSYSIRNNTTLIT